MRQLKPYVIKEKSRSPFYRVTMVAERVMKQKYVGNADISFLEQFSYLFSVDTNTESFRFPFESKSDNF